MQQQQGQQGQGGGGQPVYVVQLVGLQPGQLYGQAYEGDTGGGANVPQLYPTTYHPQGYDQQQQQHMRTVVVVQKQDQSQGRSPSDDEIARRDAEIAGRIKEYRKVFETFYEFRYLDTEDGGVTTWAFPIWGAGLVTALTSIGLSSYTTHIYWTTHSAIIKGADLAVVESMPGTVFGISVAAFAGVLLMQLGSYLIRRELNAKHVEDERDSKNLTSLSMFVEPFNYLAAAAVLALGYFCANTALNSMGTAMTCELAAITGAITGALIALPTIALGPCKLTQGTMPHVVDIAASAAAGMVALGTAHYLTEQYFLHVLGTTAVDSALTAVMQIAVAMPIFAGIKILFSIGYEATLTGMAYGGVKVKEQQEYERIS